MNTYMREDSVSNRSLLNECTTCIQVDKGCETTMNIKLDEHNTPYFFLSLTFSYFPSRIVAISVSVRKGLIRSSLNLVTVKTSRIPMIILLCLLLLLYKLNTLTESNNVTIKEADWSFCFEVLFNSLMLSEPLLSLL